jgi:hypothetical protein
MLEHIARDQKCSRQRDDMIAVIALMRKPFASISELNELP